MSVKKKVVIAEVIIAIALVAVFWNGGFISSMNMDEAAACAVDYAEGATANDVTLVTEKREGLKKVFIVEFDVDGQDYEVKVHGRSGKLLSYKSVGEDLATPKLD